MKISIIADDMAVYKDRVSFFNLDFSAVPADVHALQFDTVQNTGHIEYKDKPNETISVIPYGLILCYPIMTKQLKAVQLIKSIINIWH
jgi:hypothetical protein